MPVINGQFAYKTLVDVMRNVSLVAGLKFPTANFTLVDVRSVSSASGDCSSYVQLPRGATWCMNGLVAVLSMGGIENTSEDSTVEVAELAK